MAFVPPREPGMDATVFDDETPDATVLARYRARLIATAQEEERAEGLRPRRGRPKKHFGPREANGRASRRKTDNLDQAGTWSEEPDILWRNVVLDAFISRSRLTPPKDTLFLDLARRCVLDSHPFKIALLWWSARCPVINKSRLRDALSIKADIGFEWENGYPGNTNEGREIARKELGDDFARRMDAAIFNDTIPDIPALIADLMAVRDVWRSKKPREDMKRSEMEKLVDASNMFRRR
jgi:hypothetical protein